MLSKATRYFINIVIFNQVKDLWDFKTWIDRRSKFVYANYYLNDEMPHISKL